MGHFVFPWAMGCGGRGVLHTPALADQGVCNTPLPHSLNGVMGRLDPGRRYATMWVPGRCRDRDVAHDEKIV